MKITEIPVDPAYNNESFWEVDLHWGTESFHVVKDTPTSFRVYVWLGRWQFVAELKSSSESDAVAQAARILGRK